MNPTSSGITLRVSGPDVDPTRLAVIDAWTVALVAAAGMVGPLDLEIAVSTERPGLVRGRTVRTGPMDLRITILIGDVGEADIQRSLAHEIGHAIEIALVPDERLRGWASWAARLRSEFLAERMVSALLARTFGIPDGRAAARASEWLSEFGVVLDDLTSLARAVHRAVDSRDEAGAMRILNEAVAEMLILFAYAAGALAGDGLDPAHVFCFPGLTEEISGAVRRIFEPLFAATVDGAPIPDAATLRTLVALTATIAPLFEREAIAVGSGLLAASDPTQYESWG